MNSFDNNYGIKQKVCVRSHFEYSEYFVIFIFREALVKRDKSSTIYNINGIHIQHQVIGDMDNLAKFFESLFYQEARKWFNGTQIHEFSLVEIGDDWRSHLYYVMKRKQKLIVEAINFVANDYANDFGGGFEEKWYRGIAYIMRNWKIQSNK